MTDVVCYYHDPVKAPLLRDAVLPALDAAQAAFPEVEKHLERHWLHGPHIRARLRGTDAQRAATLIADRLREYLPAHPSTVDIPEAQQRAHARTAGVAELLTPPFEPFYPNNSVHVEPSDTSNISALLGSPTLVELREHGLRLGLPAIQESLAALGRAGDGSRDRVRLAVTVMAVYASQYPHGIRSGYHCFLSHLEDFLLHADPDGRIRARFDAIWAGNVEPVTEAVRRVADGCVTNDLESAWRAWAIGMRSATEAVHDRGELPEENPAHGRRAYEIGDLAAIRRYNATERRLFSDYHTQLATVNVDDPLINRSFTVYRFGGNVLYQLLMICDVTPVERYLAANLVAHAVQGLLGSTWSEQFAAARQAQR